MQATPERHLPHQLSAVEAAQAIRHGRLTSEQLVRSCLDHIARRDLELHAWAAIDEAIALESAGRWTAARRAALCTVCRSASRT